MSAAADGSAVTADQVHREVSELLFREARLLDTRQFREWLELLSEEVRYRLTAPISSVFGSRSEAAGGETVLMEETYGSLKARVQQLSTPAYTIAENPRSRVRRFVTNILIDSMADDCAIHVHSNALVYYSRGAHTEPHLFSMARNDIFKKAPGRLLLLRRDSQLDESIIDASNISTLF